MRAVLTPEDLKKGDLVEPGWYPAIIDKYEEKDAKTDKSCNSYFHFKLVDPAPEKVRGIGPRTMFNEKALGFGKNLWNTLELPFDPVTGYSLSTELFQKTVGFKLQIYIKRGKSDNGNEFNDVADYRKWDGSIPKDPTKAV